MAENKANLLDLKGVSAKDKAMLEAAENLLGAEPETMGFMKNLFWGRFREDLIFPYPEYDAAEKARCDKLLAELKDYLDNEHPRIYIDQEQEIPEWAIQRLFDLGVMGMTVPEQYGGLGLGITSYNRVIEMIGSYCASTSVMVSAHQSIGCKAIMLFGNEAQKNEWLPVVSRQRLSAFCLSEPNVGSDAAGQETRCEWNEAEQCYILNGEKKWSTSGAMSAMFTVMAKQYITDKRTGKEKDAITALICTPDMEGVEVFQKNRSKCGIRGTWQARIRFTNVKVPKENLLHKEGRGLQVALTCLNFGRCTLSAGIKGAADRAADQATKWVHTRYQFQRPLSDFELVRMRIARMHAMCYAMDALLYLMTGMLDRHDEDIMVETAAVKVFCSEMGWQVLDDAMEIMGGDGYMTENELERSWRDSRIYRIVEGSNEVMQPFIFGYGGKQLAENMLNVLNAVRFDEEKTTAQNLTSTVRNALKPAIMKRGMELGSEVFLGLKTSVPKITDLHPTLKGEAELIARRVQDLTYHFKVTSKRMEEQIVGAQVTQARLADVAIYVFAMSATLSKLDDQIQRGESGPKFARDRSAALHFIDWADKEIARRIHDLTDNTDESMKRAAEAALTWVDGMPNDQFYIPEASPVAKGTGKTPQADWIKQFPGNAEPFTPGNRDDVASTASGDGASPEADYIEEHSI